MTTAAWKDDKTHLPTPAPDNEDPQAPTHISHVQKFTHIAHTQTTHFPQHPR